MAIHFRKAIPSDATGVHTVATSLSKSLIESEGADEGSLSNSGFLMYPLSANNPEAPNYLERIEASEHFWVALDGTQVIAFTMAYSFDCFNSFSNKTENDVATINYFTKHMGTRGSVIYFAQIGVKPEYKRKNIAKDLVHAAYGEIDGAKHPAIICEIAQTPLWNKASTMAALACGFSPAFLREKDTHLPEENRRISGTFIKNFQIKSPPEKGYSC